MIPTRFKRDVGIILSIVFAFGPAAASQHATPTNTSEDGERMGLESHM